MALPEHSVIAARRRRLPLQSDANYPKEKKMSKGMDQKKNQKKKPEKTMKEKKTEKREKKGKTG